MTLKVEQYSEIADGYARAAIDPSVPPEGKEEFAKKAEWFRFLAERQRKHSPKLNEESASAPHYSIFEADRLDPPKPRSFMPFLTTLWLVGAGVYFLTTLLFSYAVNLSGNDDRQIPSALSVSVNHQEPVSGISVAPVTQIKPKQGDGAAGVQRPTRISDARKHAISLDEPATESPTISPSPLCANSGSVDCPDQQPPRAEQITRLVEFSFVFADDGLPRPTDCEPNDAQQKRRRSASQKFNIQR